MFKWGGFNASYYGKTKHHFKVQFYEHLGIRHRTGKKVNVDNSKPSRICEPLLYCHYFPPFEYIIILTTENNEFKLTMMESLLNE